jgi:aminomethyltransferase
LTDVQLDQIMPFHFAFGEVASTHCLISRTGYTGEDGFELYCSPADAERLWDALIEGGAPLGLVPAGLGARDTLRLEKAYPLYGHELDDTTTPLEAGLEWVTKFSKPAFIGRDVLVRQKESGIERKLVGLELLDPGIARSGYPISKDGKPAGRVTSGTRSPTLGCSVALGYVAIGQSQVGNVLDVEIRGRKTRAGIVPLPFYKRADSSVAR